MTVVLGDRRNFNLFQEDKEAASRKAVARKCCHCPSSPLQAAASKFMHPHKLESQTCCKDKGIVAQAEEIRLLVAAAGWETLKKFLDFLFLHGKGTGGPAVVMCQLQHRPSTHMGSLLCDALRKSVLTHTFSLANGEPWQRSRGFWRFATLCLWWNAA